jgi:hypothetical protein
VNGDARVTYTEILVWNGLMFLFYQTFAQRLHYMNQHVLTMKLYVYVVTGIAFINSFPKAEFKILAIAPNV